MEKTNVMRILDKNKINYKEYTYIGTEAISRNRSCFCS